MWLPGFSELGNGSGCGGVAMAFPDSGFSCCAARGSFPEVGDLDEAAENQKFRVDGRPWGQISDSQAVQAGFSGPGGVGPAAIVTV